ncbi:PIN domain-containing protein [Roseofilum casamattae]|uniref:PIN domain-containing protein n=1 Tax=Roseofilum casamattae BLCC-M143 TaxID=3022442 RepID=A0ABT7BXF4_9CYAN|nr:PIN domain-containing protein [Roseofilum casamattae]MDJ1183214.1 hypothetical protein [Roseofilum casamattae BLCC-M143]
MITLYLDVCCLNRPFDDWSQDRVRLEGEAILSIIERIDRDQWQLIGSEAIAVELEKMSNLEKKSSILKLLELVTIQQNIDAAIVSRSRELENFGFGLYDSFHLACAEAANADIFLSTDDRLLKNALRHENQLNITVNNPVIWLMRNLSSP